MLFLAAISARAVTKLSYMALLLGGVVFLFGAAASLRRVSGRGPNGTGLRERWAFLLAGVIFGGGFALGLLATILK